MTDETAPTPAISDAAVEAAARVIRLICFPGNDTAGYGTARAALLAALPHLTVPAPPTAPGRLIITTEMLDAVEGALHQLYGNDAATGDGVTILHAAFKASTRPVLASCPPAAPPAPDRLDEFAAWMDSEYEAFGTGWEPSQGMVDEFRATRPAPAAPTWTAEEAAVLAEIEAMGFKAEVMSEKPTWFAGAKPINPEVRPHTTFLAGVRRTRLAAIQALRHDIGRHPSAIAAAQQPQEDADHGDQ